MADRLDDLWGAFELDDQAWEEARESLKRAIAGFEKRVRDSL